MTGRPQNRPAPSDWASRCSAMGVLALRNHYHCGTAAIWRWARESGIEPKQSRNRPKLTPPDDFAEYGTSESVLDLMGRYQCSESVIHRWRKLIGITGTEALRAQLRRPVPASFASVAPTMGKEALCAYYRTSRQVIERWLDEAGVQPRRARSHRHMVASIAAGPDSSIAGQAQRHLQRLMPVVRASVVRPKADGYLVGGRLMATEEMVAMARSKGWNPDAWKAL